MKPTGPILPTASVLIVLLVTALPLQGQITRTWSGAGSDALASTAANWNGAIAPQAGDSVRFDATHQGNAWTNVTWDLDIAIADWTQTADYDGTVTILTRYPGQGAFTNLSINGNCVIEGGAWTHSANTGDHAQHDRLSVSVGGNFVLGTGAVIDLDGRGYASLRGPGAGISAQGRGRGASHGGMGGYQEDYFPAHCYGVATRPETLGSGGRYRGGGALFLLVAGQATLDGNIRSRGIDADRHSGAAGGSIFVQAATVTGSGILRADGGSGQLGVHLGFAGGGGRMALIATNGPTLGAITTLARTGSGGRFGTAGTVFRQTTAGAYLLIDHDNRPPQTEVVRIYPGRSQFRAELELPASLETFAIPPVVVGELEDATLIITNRGMIALTRDLRLGDFTWLDTHAALDLNGYSLFLKAPEPAGVFPADYGGGTILTNGGRIIWGNAAPTVKLDVYTYNSSVTTNPVSPTGDGYYDVGTDVTLNVNPNPGTTFLWWKGDLPEGTNRTTHPLTVPMDGRRDLTPVVASSDPDTRTWIGEGADRLASTAGNWYPATAPTSGQHIVFDAASDMQCYWDLEIEPASWTQTADYRWFYSGAAGYHGCVWIWTRYPGFGSFTNLAIRGDCLLDGGAWTHRANSGVDDATDRLSVTMDGNFRLAGESRVIAINRGFAVARGPGAGITGQRNASGRGGSHGGLGGFNPTLALPGKTYGSITAPTTLGSGSANAGGGALLMHATGSLTIEGEMHAYSDRLGDTMNPGGAGGSIYLRGAALTGSGRLVAKGAVGYYPGGGGRIAVVLTNAIEFGSPPLAIEASGAHHSPTMNSAAGTIYLEGWSGGAPAVRRLMVDNLDILTAEHAVTELMPTDETYDPHPAVDNEIADAALELHNRGRVQLSSAVRIGDFTLLDADSSIDLNTATLYVKADEPAGDFPGDYGGGTIINWGDIIWGDESVKMPLITTSGPNGWVERDPESPDDFYAYGTAVTLTANPDPDHAFLYWQGDIPEGSNRTSNPLVVIMDRERQLHAIFASTAPDTHTWIGDGDDVLASTASNWYPNVAPTAGAHIVLDATSVKEMHWDLDVAVASWTQTEGYEAYYTPAEGYFGWVVIQTKYPGQGSFTNLVITGNLALDGGTWTHPHNSGDHDAVDWMSVSVGGDFRLGTHATIDVRGRGFANSRGPGAGNTAQRLAIGFGASHGGQGAWGTDCSAPAPTYGSFNEPTTLGSGANGRGGGAVRLTVAGNATIEGLIDADGVSGTDLQPSGSGGSILLRAARLVGDGRLRVRGPYGGYQEGAGGRIAVILSKANDFGAVTFDAAANSKFTGTRAAAAGTVYLESAGTSALGTGMRHARLWIDNRNLATTPGRVRTPIPSDLDAPGSPPLCLEGYYAALTITNRAEVQLNTSLRMRDLFLHTNTPTHLHLQGHTLFLRSPYHADWGHDDWVTYQDGEIIWSLRGTIIQMR